MRLYGKKIHMIGIGGIGMSGLAQLLAAGNTVSGSDVEETAMTRRLKASGISVVIGHRGRCVSGKDLVVFSSSIRKTNPELLAAQKKRIPVIPRIELLKRVMETAKTAVAVTGTHGKTTITAMASVLAEEAGLDPTVLIGGESPYFKGNAKQGKGRLFIAEVDESDGRFAILTPAYIVMPNLEKEHPEFYKSEEHLMETFREFMRRQSRRTHFLYRYEDRNLRMLVDSFGGHAFSFGFSREADLSATGITIQPAKTAFTVFRGTKRMGRFEMNIPGVHNITNALAVLSLGCALGIESRTMKKALLRYRNVKRRFQVWGEVNGATVVEDYAHHPTEIRATIAAAASLRPKRLITVFQPHRYSRTKSFYREFAGAFGGSSRVILTDIYPASEAKIKGVSTGRIYDLMKRAKEVPVLLLEKERIPGYLAHHAKRGDLILILGAGDINKAARETLALSRS